MANLNHSNRRQVLKMGAGALAGAFGDSIAKALAIPAQNAHGTIMDVEHIVVLMQENRPFDHHFGTLRGVRGFADPRAVEIHLPLQNSDLTAKASVFLQPAGASNVAAGFSAPAANFGGPANGVPVIPPYRINPAMIGAVQDSLGFAYIDGTNHGWTNTHLCWNNGQYDSWASVNGPLVMSYFTRADIPVHYALADAFTVLDNYHSSIMGPTNPNRCYLWSGCIGNVDYLGAAGTDGHGAGPITGNGLSPNNAYLAWETLPEELNKAGVTWKVYQDLAGATFAPDFGDGGSADNFSGNYTDNPLLYFAQYAASSPGSSLYNNACTGTQISLNYPSANASSTVWEAWAQSQFQYFAADVKNGTLPQVSWLITPYGYSEHPEAPVNYGAWYIGQLLEILVSNPAVFSKTAFIINYDEADGSFDHLVPPTPPLTYPASPANGASTVDYHDEIVTDATPNGPIGLGTRVPALVISPWSKGGYVNSQVFDHTSVIQFIEQRFGFKSRNLSPWRRAVCGDLTSAFNFKTPNGAAVQVPSVANFLPPVGELSGVSQPSGVSITTNSVIPGIPAQEKGVRPACALPYEMDAYASADAWNSTVNLTFVNTGRACVVFQVRSGNVADPVRSYTVEPGKSLLGSWTVSGAYDLSVYGPNGFARFFKGSLSGVGAALQLGCGYGVFGPGAIKLTISNKGSHQATVNVVDAYTGERITRALGPNGGQAQGEIPVDQFGRWYDLLVTVAEDASFSYRLTGHVETGAESISDPAMGGLVTLKV